MNDIAKVNRTSIKKTANMLIERGLSSYMGEEIEKYIQTELETKELNREPALQRFIKMLKRLAKEKGHDVNKIFYTSLPASDIFFLRTQLFW